MTTRVTDDELTRALEHIETSCRADKQFYAKCIRELLALRRQLAEAKGALLMGAASLHEDAHRWTEHNGNPKGFAAECREDASQLRALAGVK